MKSVIDKGIFQIYRYPLSVSNFEKSDLNLPIIRNIATFSGTVLQYPCNQTTFTGFNSTHNYEKQVQQLVPSVQTCKGIQ